MLQSPCHRIIAVGPTAKRVLQHQRILKPDRANDRVFHLSPARVSSCMDYSFISSIIAPCLVTRFLSSVFQASRPLLCRRQPAKGRYVPVARSARLFASPKVMPNVTRACCEPGRIYLCLPGQALYRSTPGTSHSTWTAASSTRGTRTAVPRRLPA